MPKTERPLTKRQETFCHAIVEGGSALDAFRASGYAPNASDKTATEKASRLLGADNIKARIAEIREPVAQAAGLTLAEHLAMLQMIRDEARTDHRHSAAVAAEVARGKACGLYVDRVELEHKEPPKLVLTLNAPDIKGDLAQWVRK
jgi:phage terminase small subunit